MKYFTKEWYNDTVLSEMCFQVKHTSNAEKFNEKYFNSLYKAQKKWFVKNEKRVARFNKVAFDLAAAEADFEKNFNENLEFIKKNLPQEILDSVADLRILAMGSASYEVTQAITRFCGQVNRRCEAVKDRYDEEVEKLAEVIGWYKINLLNIILNAPISELGEDGNGNLTVKTSPEYTDVACLVTLSSHNVTECDEGLVGSTILHLELLPTANGRMEFNLLCQSPASKALLFSAEMGDIEVEEIC